MLDNLKFSSLFLYLAIDKIPLIEELSKNFCPFYAEIKRVRKHIPPQVYFLGVSAILIKVAQFQLLAKAGFYDKYKLMQTTLDSLEIEQIYCFMIHPKFNLLDL